MQLEVKVETGESVVKSGDNLFLTWILAAQVDWEVIAKTWGPLGVIFVLTVIGIIAGAKMVKSLILGSIADARQERDYMRQQREREATAFIQSLKEQGVLMTAGFDEVLREIRTRRK